MAWVGIFYIFFSAHWGSTDGFVLLQNNLYSSGVFDTPGTSMYLNTLFLLSHQLCFIITFICDFLIARNDS